MCCESCTEIGQLPTWSINIYSVNTSQIFFHNINCNNITMPVSINALNVYLTMDQISSYLSTNSPTHLNELFTELRLENNFMKLNRALEVSKIALE